MCGIAGILSSAAAQGAEPLMHAMIAQLHHRGPDDAGIWSDVNRGITLGHRRLSILDLSDAGHQPMLSASGRYVLVFNGEIYNHTQLRATLSQNSPAFTAWRGHSDTETLLAAIDAWGFEETLRAAKGMFALAVWDRQRNVLLLARDRLGEKPLYYGWQGDVFLFGSELKALKAHPAFRADIDRGALVLLLRHNCVPAPHSIYRGIHKLPAGSWLEVSLDKPEAAPLQYWRLAEVAARGVADPLDCDDTEALRQLEAVMLATVREQMMTDVPLGALLSGGIDSSLVCALMQSNSMSPVKTFTIGFSESRHNEADHARRVATHLRSDHTDWIFSPSDALALIPELPRVWDEPFADSSQLPTLLVMKLARQQVSVALSGDGGDEMFAGYNRYAHAPRLVRRIGWLPSPVRRAAGSLLTTLPAPTVNAAFGALAARFSVAGPGDKVHKLGQKLRDVDVSSVNALYRALLTEWPNAAELVIDGVVPYNLLDDEHHYPALENPVERMMTLDGLIYLPDDILVKVDRAAMAVSLETRTPFLDRDVVEFAWRLPLPFKQQHGQGKWLLRRLLDRYVPRELIERPKMGFAVPLDEWLRGPLRDWAEDLLAEGRLARDGYFVPGPVRKTWEQHCARRGNYGQRLWSVLMFQCWLQDNA